MENLLLMSIIKGIGKTAGGLIVLTVTATFWMLLPKSSNIKGTTGPRPKHEDSSTQTNCVHNYQESFNVMEEDPLVFKKMFEKVL